MSRALPPLDLHAHISPEASARELEGLGAVVWAATRSQAEYERVAARRDLVTVWGVGCHPGLESAQRDFEPARFASLIEGTALVSEIGLDAGSKVPMDTQRQTFTGILELLVETPRVTSVHSAGATSGVLDCLERIAGPGVVLHWWLGDKAETERAVALGCYFSINHAMTVRSSALSVVPIERLLVETDHPDGDRRSARPRQPGAVHDVEEWLARMHGLTAAALRQQVWRNLSNLVGEAGVRHRLPGPVKKMLAVAETL